MKNNIKFLGEIILPTTPCLLFERDSTYTINGKVGQLSAPAKACLRYGNGPVRQTGSTVINNAAPQNFLIDPNGVVIGKNLRGEELDKKLASLFN